MFNKEFLEESINYCLPYAGSCEKYANKILSTDPIFGLLKDLRQSDSRSLNKINPSQDRESWSKIDSGERKEIALSLPLYKSDIYSNSKFKYTSQIDDILVTRFSQFGLYKDFENLMRNAIMFYSENDEISTFDYLLQKNKILREILLGKMDPLVSPDATLRYQLEAAMISFTYEEIDKRIDVSIFIYFI
jgi:hypothetical protein